MVSWAELSFKTLSLLFLLLESFLSSLSFLLRECLYWQSSHSGFDWVYQTHSSEWHQQARERERESKSSIIVPFSAFEQESESCCLCHMVRFQWWLTAGSDWPSNSSWWVFAQYCSTVLARAGNDHPCHIMCACTHDHHPIGDLSERFNTYWWSVWAIH